MFDMPSETMKLKFDRVPELHAYATRFYSITCENIITLSSFRGGLFIFRFRYMRERGQGAERGPGKSYASSYCVRMYVV